jgi:hypothetical protein
MTDKFQKMLMDSYDAGVADAREAAIEALEVVVKKAVEAEREACAEICEEGTEEPLSVTALKICLRERNRIANAIRARGEK